jgi:O-Antigen ligase
MNNSAAILRMLIIYGICIPLAIVVGCVVVSVANVPTYANFGTLGMLVLILSAPILLRWHHPLLVLCWNLPLTIFFLRGSPPIYLLMVAVSLGISVLQRAMNRDMRFVPAPQIALPLVLLGVVALVTAKLTGGIGLHMLGDPVMGGKKYIFLLAGILAYFALTARRIPPKQARLYMALFFLSGVISVFGDLIAFIPASFYFIFLLLPPDIYAYTASESAARFTGVSLMSLAIFSYMLARYGINGIFRAAKPWRIAAFILFSSLVLFGGFRSMLAWFVLLFTILFFLEGMHRTKLVPIFGFAIVLAGLICIPMADRLPYTFQRALSFLPVKINPAVRAAAQASIDWRLDMWRALLPEVSPHLLLGKGYAITLEDYQVMAPGSAFRNSINPAEQGLALAGDYHSGPLSVILPFGIWGVIVVVWLLTAGVWALYHNYRYGDPALQTFNTFFLAAFLAKIISFIFIFGALSSDIAGFVSYLGLSVSLNGGICRRARSPVAAEAEPPARLPERPRWQPAFQR